MTARPEILEVWREPEGFWRWRYRQEEEGTDLLSNEVYETPEKAGEAARTAYPGVPVVVRLPDGRSGSGLGGTLRASFRIAALLAAVALIVASVPLALVLLWTRLRRRLMRSLGRAGRPGR